MKLEAVFQQVAEASRLLNLLPDEKIKTVLYELAEETEQSIPSLLEANRADLARMDAENPKYDRLQLTEARLRDIADSIRYVADFSSPVGHVLREYTLDNGLRIRKVTVPFGVIGVIYEARPNVSFDVFSLCFKAGSACVLKGGKDAEASNLAIAELIHRVLERNGLNPHTVELLPATHEATSELLHAREYVDLLIPRGGKGLIQFVRDNASVPVIETGAGVCHAYFDKDGDREKGQRIVVNAKTRRVSVCNALDCLLVHKDRLADLPFLLAPMAAKRVVVYADAAAFQALEKYYPQELLVKAEVKDYGTEFQSYAMSVKTVSSLEEALNHILRYGSHHSESIITENKETGKLFQQAVDAACVYVNAPTSFTDGGQFGLGAEIGISTQKLHARGPMGLDAIVTYKWFIDGDGQTRP